MLPCWGLPGMAAGGGGRWGSSLGYSGLCFCFLSLSSVHVASFPGSTSQCVIKAGLGVESGNEAKLMHFNSLANWILNSCIKVWSQCDLSVASLELWDLY